MKKTPTPKTRKRAINKLSPPEPSRGTAINQYYPKRFKTMKQNNGDKSGRVKWLWLSAIFALAVLIAVLARAALMHGSVIHGKMDAGSSGKISERTEKKECSGCVRRYIDGVYVSPGKENPYPSAVIIENHPDARPQFGLSRANLVYEAEAEGGITRFLAVFSGGENLDKIGPVRSARPYFVGWARGLSALFAHSGGSPEALAQIAKENIFDLNEFYNEKYFWRDKSTRAPHNLFTSSEKLNEYLNLKQRKQGKFLSWRFKGGDGGREEPSSEVSKSGSAGEITIGFELPEFAVKWKYDPRNNDYVRYMGGQAHKDANGENIRAKNVAVMYVKARVVDEKLRLKMEYIGEGEALVCLDGKCEKGEWRKKTDASRVRFYEKNGEEFIFNAGATWIEAVRPEIDVAAPL